jgi:hypothetical protein
MTAEAGLPLLRALLREQLRAAGDGRWEDVTALGPRVAEAVAAARSVAAHPGALAEVAHLQLRLQALLGARAAAAAERLRRAAAGHAYLRLRPGP